MMVWYLWFNAAQQQKQHDKQARPVLAMHAMDQHREILLFGHYAQPLGNLLLALQPNHTVRTQLKRAKHVSDVCTLQSANISHLLLGSAAQSCTKNVCHATTQNCKQVSNAQVPVKIGNNLASSLHARAEACKAFHSPAWWHRPRQVP